MKIRILPIILIITFLMIFFIFYKGLENSNIYIPENNIKKAIPSLNVKKFDNDDKINFVEIFKGDKFYLMNIWASWCAPCKNEHPFLMSLSNLKSIEIIGLNYKDDNDNAKRFLKELDNPYKINLSDKDGTIAIEWGAYGVPESFLIYKKKIIKKIIGPLNEKEFLEIKKMIK